MQARTAMVVALICLTTAAHTFAQGPATLVVSPSSVVATRLFNETPRESFGIDSSRATAARQQAPASRKRTGMKWGGIIGCAAGAAGGALQPTHSNGEYVLAGNRLGSAVVLGGIGLGIGMLIGLAIDRAKD